MKKKKFTFINILFLSKFLIFIINKFSNFFVFLPNTHFGNRAEDILNVYVHCQNLEKKPIIICVFNIFFFIKKSSRYKKIFLFFFSPAEQNNSICYLENTNFPKQNIILKIIMSIIVTAEFYFTRIFHLLFYSIFYYNKNIRRSISNMFAIKCFNEFHFYEYLKKNKIKGYSTKELDTIKSGWYFRQFKNIDEEREYIYKKLKINQNRWYVCIHARSKVFYNEKEESIRNIKFNSLIPSIKTISKNGGITVKIGEQDLKLRQKKMKNFINFHSAHYNKSEIDDLLIIKYCRFIIGGSSGPIEVANIFNKPVVAINISYLMMCNWINRGSVLVTAKIFDKKNKRYLDIYNKLNLIIKESLVHSLENNSRYLIIHRTASEINDIIIDKLSNNLKKSLKENNYYKSRLYKKNFSELYKYFTKSNYYRIEYEKKRMLSRITGKIYGAVY